MRTNESTWSPPETLRRASNMVVHEMKSKALIPSIDRTVAWGSAAVNTWRTSATHSVHARVFAVKCSTAETELLCKCPTNQPPPNIACHSPPNASVVLLPARSASLRRTSSTATVGAWAWQVVRQLSKASARLWGLRGVSVAHSSCQTDQLQCLVSKISDSAQTTARPNCMECAA